MNFQQIRYFTVLCEKGSFGKAAESLFITQQGLSMAISNLEDELSCRLFQRTAKGVVLTEEGKFFRIRAERILNDVNDCLDFFQGRTNQSGSIKLASCEGALSEFFVHSIREFEEQFPDFTVYLREFKDKPVDEEVSSDRAELGFGMEPMDREKFDCRRVLTRNLVLLMPENHPLSDLERIPTRALQNLPLIMVDEQFKSPDSFMELCRRSGITVDPKFRVGEITAVHSLVRQGQGVGLSVDSVAEQLCTPGTVWRRFEDPSTTWNVDIFKKKNANLSRGAKAFYEFILRTAKRSEADL